MSGTAGNLEKPPMASFPRKWEALHNSEAGHPSCYYARPKWIPSFEGMTSKKRLFEIPSEEGNAMTRIGPKARGGSIMRPELTESLLRSCQGLLNESSKILDPGLRGMTALRLREGQVGSWTPNGTAAFRCFSPASRQGRYSCLASDPAGAASPRSAGRGH